jgi:hypothetical protein
MTRTTIFSLLLIILCTSLLKGQDDLLEELEEHAEDNSFPVESTLTEKYKG